MNIEQYRAMVAQQTEDSQVEQPTEPVEPVVEAPEPTEPVVTEPEQPQVFEIDGQEVTFEELQKGYLRQSDYTRKTQEVARQRQQIEQDLAIVERLRSSPELTEQLSSIVPELDSKVNRERQLEAQLFDIMLERDIDRLSSKYSDFDVQEVLTLAQEKNLTNIEDAYLLLKSIKPNTQTAQETKIAEENTLDIQALTAQIKADLLKELQEQNTTSIIGTGADVPPRVQAEPQLSDSEKRVVQGMGLSSADYVKWRDAGRKKN